ncbi:carbon monoxide dehydrogenase subunit G [Ramlibacter sp. USB13]|uniref:Carbon monoxide dehydrogenase subunit G n=1 Tax=Ramlibacter cellulosilyticus TaxID=2764187 RepID=A0A923MTC8_9BURK|nr:carbon monoxide dehydrogenase subunit G [Ramlibacter cellulosilyticus]MBC5784815.1 carbon monoxide dehydrogenase subunit G [Ramlibacter cellulosilyticus]
MDMQGSRHLAVTQQQAWEALNDPEVLKICIPGCDKVEATGENQYAIGMAVKIGPVAARFNGKILLADVLPPNSYTLAFEGQGGAAGFGKGSAKVNLAPAVEGAGCELAYTAQAQVGGKIAQVGQRLVDGVAKSMAEDFFRRFDEEMQRRHPVEVAAEKALAGAEAALPSPRKMPIWVWIVFAVVVLLALLLLAR